MNVLSLCDVSGVMVRPWIEAGHSATVVDVQHPAGSIMDGLLTRVGADVREWRPAQRYDAVFAFPPCTHLASSGARWWNAKGPAALQEALEIVQACRDIISAAGTERWLLENPVGRLTTHWRPPDYMFHPYQYGGYLTPAGDRYTKATCLWVGSAFRMPMKRPVHPAEGSKMHRLSGTQSAERSLTPAGFARAVFLANSSNASLMEIAS